jgi:hypothetical protein
MRKALTHEAAVGFLRDTEDYFHVLKVAESVTGNKVALAVSERRPTTL